MRYKANTVTSVCAVIIAVAALFVAVWSEIAIRNHNRLMVRPHLTIWRLFQEGEPFFRLEVRNRGLGPAFITSSHPKTPDFGWHECMKM